MSITGLILAGGESRRFGRDKAQYVLQGRSMIRHVYDVVAHVADPVFISTRSQPDRSLGLPARTVEDHFPGKGPLAGLHAGLTAMDTPWLLVVACDMPFLDVAGLKMLRASCSEEGKAVVAQSSDERLHPLCACYHVAVLPAVERALRANQLAMHRLLADLGSVVTVALPDAVLRNVNRPSDLPARPATDNQP